MYDVSAPATADWFSVPCVSANGSGEAQAPPELLLSTVNGALEIVLVSGFAAVDDHGVRLAVALAAPQLSGLANGAGAHP